MHHLCLLLRASHLDPRPCTVLIHIVSDSCKHSTKVHCSHPMIRCSCRTERMSFFWFRWKNDPSVWKKKRWGVCKGLVFSPEPPRSMSSTVIHPAATTTHILVMSSATHYAICKSWICYVCNKGVHLSTVVCTSCLPWIHDKLAISAIRGRLSVVVCA